MANPDFLNNAYDFWGDGIYGTATKNAVTNFDLKIINSEKFLHGGVLIVQDAVHGDWVECQIVDIDNVLGYGSNTVLQVFLNKWFVDPVNSGMNIEAPYTGKIPMNTYIRLKYHSIGLISDVKVATNYYLHKLT